MYVLINIKKYFKGLFNIKFICLDTKLLPIVLLIDVRENHRKSAKKETKITVDK